MCPQEIGLLTSIWLTHFIKPATVTAAMKLKDSCSLEEKLWQMWHIKKQRHHFANKVVVKAIVFLVVMYKYESWTIDSWVPKNWCFWTNVLEKTLESPLDSKEIKPVNPKGNQSWIFIGRTDAEAETPIFQQADVKSWLNGKDPDAGKDWRQEEKGMTEDEIAGWHHQFNGHEFEQTLRDSEGQGSLACYSSWGYKESDNWATEQWWGYVVDGKFKEFLGLLLTLFFFFIYFY